MKATEIRQKFLEFFKARGHTLVASSSLVPGNDPTLLFTNSGMVQFKDTFLGVEPRPYSRATTAQRCVRAGGKHNDLENVGYTARHHTFFEMLGNFSFGDYFKREAIHYAWELITKVYGIPAQHLWVTVYHTDEEAYQIWANEVGVPTGRIVRIGDNKGAPYASDNFWQMADVGPCGPCSEIFYDHGPDVQGGPPGSPEADGDRYIEIWNLVFMQFNRDVAGQLHPLPKPSVDTGMGLERLAAVLQGVHSNYEIDLFQDLIRAAARVTEVRDLDNPSLRVIADHVRACAFLLVDGVIPSNEGRGYVLRRIIRRAIRHGYKLGKKEPFFHRLVEDLETVMGEAYPELVQQKSRIEQSLWLEEERFGETLEHGMKLLEAELPKIGPILPGSMAFQLYDTFGFPLDLTADICRERGVSVDEAGFAEEMAKQRQRGKAAHQFKANAALEYRGAKTDFQGYQALSIETKVLALYHEGSPVETLQAGQSGVVVLAATPFYAESGGQVGDQGFLRCSGGAFQVADTQKIQPEVFGHYGELVEGALTVGASVQAEVDASPRRATMRNHSATHLLHKALREVLGPQVQQKGSLVDAQKTRFDFSYDQPLTAAQLEQVEAIANREILANVAAQVRLVGYDEALQLGATALFGEKYGDVVRVVDLGFSRELCGGTHVERTGEIGLCKIVAETGVAAGVRRIEAVTGENALIHLRFLEQQLEQVALALRSPVQEATQKARQILEQLKKQEKELQQLKIELAKAQTGVILQKVQKVAGIQVLPAQLEAVDVPTLRELMDRFKAQLQTAAIVLATVVDGKVVLLAGVTEDLKARLPAGELVNFVALQVGGKGGGRPDLAQAGGNQPSALPVALASVANWVEQRLG